MNKVKLLIRMLGLTQVQVRPKHQVRSDMNVLLIEGLIYQISLWELMKATPFHKLNDPTGLSEAVTELDRNWMKLLKHGDKYSWGFKPDLFILDDLQHMTNIKGSF